MTKATKLVLAAATLAPFLLFYAAKAILSSRGEVFFDYFMIVVGLNVAILIVLAVFYIVHVTKQEDMTSVLKTLWTMAVLVSGPIGMGAYWYVNIWNESPASTRLARCR